MQYKEWCGLFGTDLIDTVKSKLSEIDKKIVHYNFSFMANAKITYTAVYVNTSDEVGHVKLALTDGDMVLSAKTYQEYSKEKDALVLSLHPKESDKDTQPAKETSYIVIDKQGGGSTILPRTEADKKRNAGSTLMQYEHDYCLQFFLLENVKMSVSKTESIVKFIFKNTSGQKYRYAYVYCDFINKDGIVIYQSMDGIDNVKQDQSYAMEISKYYGSSGERPDSFRITKISLYPETGSSFSLTFD